MFSGILEMHRRCPDCDYDFYPEPGFYLGSMVAAYFIGAFSVVPTVVGLWYFGRQELSPVAWIGIPCLQILMFTPFLLRVSKAAWLNAEYRITRQLDGGGSVGKK